MTLEFAGRIIVAVDDVLADLIPGFLANREDDIRTIREALDRHDFRLIRRLGHSMKGAGAGYGFDAITEIGAAMEQAALDGNAATVIKEVEALVAYLQRVDVVGQLVSRTSGG